MLSSRFPFTWSEQIGQVQKVQKGCPTFQDTLSSTLPTSPTTELHSRETCHSRAIEERFHAGAFGEMFSVSVDEFAEPKDGEDAPEDALVRENETPFSKLHNATSFSNISLEWKKRIAELHKTNKSIECQCKMASEVQRSLTVMILHQLHRQRSTNPEHAERFAMMPLWQRCLYKLEND